MKIVHSQESAFSSPWTRGQRVKMLLWEYAWKIFCSWTPKPANAWRLFWLKLFGAKIEGRPFVHQRARIQIPWNITLLDRAAVGDRTNLYSLGRIIIKENATVAQEAYICTGTHDFDSPNLNLITSPIIIGEHAFIGVRAIILPGVKIGTNTIIGAGSIVSKDMPDNMVCVGNPCRPIKKILSTHRAEFVSTTLSLK